MDVSKNVLTRERADPNSTLIQKNLKKLLITTADFALFSSLFSDRQMARTFLLVAFDKFCFISI